MIFQRSRAHPTSRPLLYLAHLIGCVMLLIPAFYNGFGILNSDFGTYLPSGFKPEMPVDRPITYGLLLRIFSLNGLSLWLALFAQAFFISNLIIRLVKYLSGNEHYLFWSLLIIFLLSIGTPLSWTVSQFQPDIYTGIALLCMVVLLIADEGKLMTKLTCTLYFMSIGTHFSNVMIFLVLLIMISIIYSRSLFKEKRKRVFLLAVLTIVPVITMLTPMAKSKHVFLMGSLLEKGVLKEYLDNTCSTEQYKLCAYKDVLPAKGDDFIWDGNSPVYKEGGWAKVKPEYDKVINDIFSSPEYLWSFAKRSAEFTVKQLYSFDLGPGNITFQKGTFVHDGLERYTPRELSAFDSSRQQRGMLLNIVTQPNLVFPVIVIFSIMVILTIIIVRKRTLSRDMIFVMILCSLAVLINAWDCGTFSNVNGRYGFRMIWSLPLCALLLLVPLRIVKR